MNVTELLADRVAVAVEHYRHASDQLPPVGTMRVGEVLPLVEGDSVRAVAAAKAVLLARLDELHEWIVFGTPPDDLSTSTE